MKSRALLYRPEIDGLRALAVIVVIFFHADVPGFSGGYVGVDVFFVISGYLIASIIYSDIVEGRFSIVRFYDRRIRRILPALFFVCFICIPFAWIWMLPGEMERFFESLFSVSVFASNIYFWRALDYFAQASDLQPLLHTWSLSVEEQFYIFFPVLLLILKGRSVALHFVLISIVCLLSLMLAQWASIYHPGANFFLLPTRAWELGVGALITFIRITKKDGESSAHRFGALLGVVLIVFSVVYFDEKTPFPSFFAVVPVLGAALVILFANARQGVGTVLSKRPVVMLGLISYSAYLWHQPIFAFARLRAENEISLPIMFGLSVVSLLVAYASWQWVEQPFRNRNLFSRTKIFVCAGLVSTLFIVFSAVVVEREGMPSRLPSVALQALQWQKSSNPNYRKCQSSSGNLIAYKDSCVYGPKDNAEVVVWGDSHAGALAYVLGEKLAKKNIGLREVSYSACAPVVGYIRPDVPKCGFHNSQVFEKIKEDSNVKFVILYARWPLLIEQTRFDNGEGGKEDGDDVLAYPAGKPDLDTKSRVISFAGLLDQQVKDLESSGKEVVIIYSTPEVGWDVPSVMARRLWKNENEEPLTTSYARYLDRTEQTRDFLDNAGGSSIYRVEPERIFCDRDERMRCLTVMESKLLYSDDDHISRWGAEKLSEKIIEEVPFEAR